MDGMSLLVRGFDRVDWCDLMRCNPTASTFSAAVLGLLPVPGRGAPDRTSVASVLLTEILPTSDIVKCLASAGSIGMWQPLLTRKQRAATQVKEKKRSSSANGGNDKEVEKEEI